MNRQIEKKQAAAFWQEFDRRRKANAQQQWQNDNAADCEKARNHPAKVGVGTIADTSPIPKHPPIRSGASQTQIGRVGNMPEVIFEKLAVEDHLDPMLVCPRRQAAINEILIRRRGYGLRLDRRQEPTQQSR